MNIKIKIFNTFRLLFRNRFFEKILIKLTKNKSPQHLFAKLPANYCQYKKPALRFTKIDGINFELDISDYMEWLLYFGINVEPRSVLYQYASNKKIIFDVGGNFGETALFFALNASSDSKIYVFEPDLLCYQKILKNISLNNFKNIMPYNFGFGFENKMYFLGSDNAHNRGENKIQPKSKLKPNVQIKRMDDFIREENITSVDFIKIDVEGFEYNVLKGGEQTIKEFRPVLFVEVNDKNLEYQGSSVTDLILFLEKYYRNIIRADNLVPVNSTMQFKNVHFDIIALP